MDFWWVRFETQLLRCLTLVAPPVISLLCNLFHEPLGYGLPVPGLPRLCWYVLNFWQADGGTLDNITDVVTGIAYAWGESTKFRFRIIVSVNLASSYLRIWLSPKVLLTLMIVTRLILHRRNFRKAIGASNRSDGLYKAVVVMLIESCALCTIAYILYITPWNGGSIGDPFSGALDSIQVRGVFTFPRRIATLSIVV